MIGRILGNRYQIIEQLGGGGMAIVYKANCTLLNRIVTVKVLRPEFTGDAEFVDRFRREAQSVAKLSHANIVSVYDVGEEDNIYYIVMEYIDGSTLKEVIQEKGKLPINVAVDFAEQICLAIGHAHENGIAHRDIKPHNILVTKGGLVKVTDFGIARAVTSSTVTNTKTIMGSVHYISPEQAEGKDSGPGSDIYSTGVVLYEMLTGKVPFDGDTAISVAIKHIQEKPVPPSRVEPAISPELERVIMRAMEKDPNLRYQSAKEMADDLKTVMEGRISDSTRVLALDEFATKVIPAEALAKELGKNLPDNGQKAKKKKMKPAAKIIIALGIILLIAAAVFGLQSYLVVPEVTVPDVTKVTFEDAKRTLEDRGLTAKAADKQYSPDVPKDRVMATNPKPGTKVKKGREIALTISLGIQTAKVPDVRKKTLTDATYELDKAGFKADTKIEFNDTLPKDSVIDQDPAPDKDAAIGSVVTLRVSKGKQPNIVQVPDLSNQTIDNAKSLLNKFGLELDANVTKQDSKDYLPGRVIDQTPKSGAPLEQGGQPVQLVVSNGPGPDKKTNQNIQLTPQDPQQREYIIKIVDAEGTREIYRANFDNKVATQTIPIPYYYVSSKYPPKYQIYMSGSLIEEKTLPF